MINKLSITDLDLDGKLLFLRVDFNVPLAQGQVADDTRIKAALPTIEFAIQNNARIVLVSHLGRPQGQRRKELSLYPVAGRLSSLLNQEVQFVDDCIGSEVRSQVEILQPGQVLVMENLRFQDGEIKNDPEFARQLGMGVQEYVNDAFGVAHRAHASTVGVPSLLGRGAAGFLVARELDYLSRVRHEPQHPVVAILGGAKVSDKIEVIESLLGFADTILIGGGMAFTFLQARGESVGNSLVEQDKIEVAEGVIARARSRGVSLQLPVDSVVARKCQPGVATHVEISHIGEGWMGLDIGPQTVETFQQEIARANTLFWNGPLGVFEIEEFSLGTVAIAKAVADSSALSVVGGGDSVTAVVQSGLGEAISHLSTGGGASLAFMAERALPGVEILTDK
ncbi:MAG: phosphoglycerate kinase [Acidobacteriota bacterium]